MLCSGLPKLVLNPCSVNESSQLHSVLSVFTYISQRVKFVNLSYYSPINPNRSIRLYSLYTNINIFFLHPHNRSIRFWHRLLFHLPSLGAAAQRGPGRYLGDARYDATRNLFRLYSGHGAVLLEGLFDRRGIGWFIYCCITKCKISSIDQSILLASLLLGVALFLWYTKNSLMPYDIRYDTM